MSNYKAPQLRVDLASTLTKEFNNFCEMGLAREIYCILLSYVVRKPFKSYRDPLNLYNNYYKKGMLVARWSQIHIAKKLNIHQSSVSRHIKKLEQAGYVIKHREYLYGKPCIIYQLGTHSDNIEQIYLLERLRASVLIEKQKDIAEQQEEYYEGLKSK